MAEAGLIAVGAGLAIGLSALAAAWAEKHNWCSSSWCNSRKRRTLWESIDFNSNPRDHCYLWISSTYSYHWTRRIKMAIADVKDDILVNASHQAEALQAQALEEAEHLQEKATEELALYKTEAKQRTAEQYEQFRQKELATAQFDASRIELDAKREAIDSVFSSVKEHLMNLQAKERQKLLRALYKKAKTEITVAQVYVNNTDVGFMKKLCKQVKTANIAGGLIAENKEGSVSVNLTYEELLDDAKNKLLVEVSGVLFR